MMGTLLVMKEQLKGIYAKYSFYITVGLRFFMGLLVFGLINSNVGSVSYTHLTLPTILRV